MIRWLTDLHSLFFDGQLTFREGYESVGVQYIERQSRCESVGTGTTFFKDP